MGQEQEMIERLSAQLRASEERCSKLELSNAALAAERDRFAVRVLVAEDLEKKALSQLADIVLAEESAAEDVACANLRFFALAREEETAKSEEDSVEMRVIQEQARQAGIADERYRQLQCDNAKLRAEALRVTGAICDALGSWEGKWLDAACSCIRMHQRRVEQHVFEAQ